MNVSLGVLRKRKKIQGRGEGKRAEFGGSDVINIL
jgi:hypothetical protein